MIDDDPFGAPAKKPISLEAQLETASIGDLEARIQKLQAEIVLCQEAIARKKAQRAAADSVFGSKAS